MTRATRRPDGAEMSGTSEHEFLHEHPLHRWALVARHRCRAMDAATTVAEGAELAMSWMCAPFGANAPDARPCAPPLLA